MQTREKELASVVARLRQGPIPRKWAVMPEDHIFPEENITRTRLNGAPPGQRPLGRCGDYQHVVNLGLAKSGTTSVNRFFMQAGFTTCYE
eukprot:627329-Prymnesium_polylepis.1